MPSASLPCPRCEALHPFNPRRRKLDAGRIEVYVACPTCNHTVLLRVSTDEIEHWRRMELAWEARNRALRARYISPSSLAEVQLRKIRRKIRELEHEIADN